MTQTLDHEPKHDAPPVVHCDRCGAECVRSAITPGYGVTDDGRKHCYTCCADLDRERMIATGRAMLYLTCAPAWHARKPHRDRDGVERTWRNTSATVGNWPGSLTFRGYCTYGAHNIAGVRYDVWFAGPDGFEWHGVTYGDNTQVCHCKRTKTRRESPQSLTQES